MGKAVGYEFVQATRHGCQGPSDQQRGKPPPALHLPCTGKPIALPKPASVETAPQPFRELAEQRTSLRDYANTPVSQAELSYLLWCTQGVKETHGRSASIRTVPSAGARHALETILLVNRVENLAPGLYRFHAFKHELVRLDSPNGMVDRITQACYGQTFVRTSAVTFIWIAVPYRMTWRYGERGYRYLHLDAGHVCQNLYLAAESIGGGVCAIGAYDDDEMNGLLKLDGKEQFVIYLASVGKKHE